MEKFIENIQNAQKKIQKIDHMIFVTYPLIKDKKILLNILVETKKAISHLLNAILQYEYLYKRINLSDRPNSNFKTFKEKSSKRFEINNEEIRLIEELFEIIAKHKQSSMEFIKDDKIVILSSDLKKEIITFDKTKEFLLLGKKILEKTQKGIMS